MHVKVERRYKKPSTHSEVLARYNKRYSSPGSTSSKIHRKDPWYKLCYSKHIAGPLRLLAWSFVIWRFQDIQYTIRYALYFVICVQQISYRGICIYLFIYQLFWTQPCPEGMCANGTQVPCEVPSLPNPTIRKGWPHHRGLFSNSEVGSFTSHKNKSVKVLWDGTYSFSTLSQKTRKSNHLQMSLQRQHFVLSYLKTLSVGPAGVWTRDLPLGRPAFSQLS